MDIRRAGMILDDKLNSELAEEWDNSGWAVAQHDEELTGILLCVDPTQQALSRAIEDDLNLVVSHHPLILDPIDSVVDSDPQKALMIRAIKHDISLYGAHTNVDSMKEGLNDEFAKLFKLQEVEPIEPHPDDDNVGLGRVGRLGEELSMKAVEDRLRDRLELTKLESLGEPDRTIRKIAVCTGSGGDFITHPAVQAADLYITADVDHHDALAASNSNLNLINLDHYEMEVVFVEIVEELCRRYFDDVTIETFRRTNPFRREFDGNAE
ncbi:MAG: Nif3-like dinuclear metal center hexameric protein [bacterium]